MINRSLKNGFTLIETIVVIVIIGLVMPAIFAIIFGLVREQTKIYRLSQVKREGDNILNIISTLSKNDAQSIHSDDPPTDLNEICKIVEKYPPDGSPNIDSLIFKDKLDNWFSILWSNTDNKISFYSSVTTTTVDLNSNSVIIDNFSIGCDRNSVYSPAIVPLTFDICYKTSSGDCSSPTPEETARLHYQTKIKLRNF